MAEESESLHRYSPSKDDIKLQNLVSNSNLQEFSNKISYICSLETGGKLTPKQSYRQIKALWKQLKRSREKLGIDISNTNAETKQYETSAEESQYTDAEYAEYIEITSKNSISQWISSLSANDPQVRVEAALALGELGDENAVPALSYILGSDPDPQVRRSAANALGRIGEKAAEIDGN